MKRLSSLLACAALSLGVVSCATTSKNPSADVVRIERPRIMAKAANYLKEAPVTVTATHSDRSQGGLHDFFSEGDYWWPDPANPEAPYIQHDGLTNTNNFVDHRHAMIRLSDMVATMGSAYVLTGDDKYVKHALKHLDAWFVDDATKMNPNLEYAQAIKGRFKGRSTGVIDTIHLVEVARTVKILSQSPAFPKKDYDAIKAWFGEYLTWLNTSANGLGERAASNNHGICWSMQAAAFAELVDNQEVMNWVRNQFKNVYLTRNMNTNGGFPAELGRTKPYGYSLFVIDAMAGIAQIASTPADNLWTYQTADGRGMKKGMDFIFPFIADKSTWTNRHDVLYWDEWPVRQPCLVLAAVELHRPEYLKVWKKLEADSKTAEVTRNVPLRHPLLWVGPMKPPGR